MLGQAASANPQQVVPLSALGRTAAHPPLGGAPAILSLPARAHEGGQQQQQRVDAKRETCHLHLWQWRAVCAHAHAHAHARTVPDSVLCVRSRTWREVANESSANRTPTVADSHLDFE